MSDPATPLPQSVVLQLSRDLVGPLLIGAFLNVCLVRWFEQLSAQIWLLTLNIMKYGAFLMQVQAYFRHSQGYDAMLLSRVPITDDRSNRDYTWMKAMVIVLLLIDTLNSIVSSYVAYDYSVNDFGEFAYFEIQILSFGA